MPNVQPDPVTDANIVPSTDATFDQDVMNADLPVLVDFWAPWCAPCRAMGQALEQVAPDMQGSVKIVKVNVDENPNTAARFGIRSIPTLLFVRAGDVLGMIPGALPAEALREALAALRDGRLARDPE